MGSPLQRVAILSAASFTVFAVCLTLPGALLPVLVDHFQVRLIDAGTVLACQPGAYLLAVVMAGRLIHRFGMSAVLAASLLTMALGIGAFAFAPTWPLAGVALFVCGLGLGVMEVGVNTVLIDVGGERRANLLNFAHLFFGVGAFVAPLLATHIVSRGTSWRWPFGMAAVLTAVVGSAWHAARRTQLRAAPNANAAHVPAPLDRPIAALLAAILALYVGVETGVASWLTKYLTGTRAFTLADAGDVLALYWLGLTGARLVLSIIAHHVREERLILTLATAATVALVVSISTASASVAILAFTAMGAGLSGIFPAVMAVGGRVHPHDVARITSILIAGAGTGGIAIPWMMSAVADQRGVTAGMFFYAAVSAVMVACAVGLSGALSRRRESPAQCSTQ